MTKLYAFGVIRHNGITQTASGTDYMLPLDGRWSRRRMVDESTDRANALSWAHRGVIGFVIATIDAKPFEVMDYHPIKKYWTIQTEAGGRYVVAAETEEEAQRILNCTNGGIEVVKGGRP